MGWFYRSDFVFAEILAELRGRLRKRDSIAGAAVRNLTRSDSGGQHPATANLSNARRESSFTNIAAASSDQPLYCRTLIGSNVTRPSVIIPSNCDRKPSTFSRLSTTS